MYTKAFIKNPYVEKFHCDLVSWKNLVFDNLCWNFIEETPNKRNKMNKQSKISLGKI